MRANATNAENARKRLIDRECGGGMASLGPLRRWCALRFLGNLVFRRPVILKKVKDATMPTQPPNPPIGPFDPQPRPAGPDPAPAPPQPGHAPTEVPVREPPGIPAIDPSRPPSPDPGPGPDIPTIPTDPQPRA
jgi:hypothetical protein